MVHVYDYTGAMGKRSVADRVSDAVMRHNEISLGVLYNKFRKSKRADIDDAVASLVLDGRAEVQVRTKNASGVAFKWVVWRGAQEG